MTSTDLDQEDNAICLALCIPTDCYHRVRLASAPGQSTLITLTGSFQNVPGFPGSLTISCHFPRVAYPSAVSSSIGVSWIVFSFLYSVKILSHWQFWSQQHYLKLFLASLFSDSQRITGTDSQMLQDLHSSCVQAQLNTHCTAPGSQQCPSQQLSLGVCLAALPACYQLTPFPESLSCHAIET